MLSVLSDFLNDRKQRFTLNGQLSSWTGVNEGIRHRSILVPLCFLVDINDLANGISSNAKLYANDTSLFWAIHNTDTFEN